MTRSAKLIQVIQVENDNGACEYFLQDGTPLMAYNASVEKVARVNTTLATPMADMISRTSWSPADDMNRARLALENVDPAFAAALPKRENGA